MTRARTVAGSTYAERGDDDGSIECYDQTRDGQGVYDDLLMSRRLPLDLGLPLCLVDLDDFLGSRRPLILLDEV